MHQWKQICICLPNRRRLHRLTSHYCCLFCSFRQLIVPSARLRLRSHTARTYLLCTNRFKLAELAPYRRMFVPGMYDLRRRTLQITYGQIFTNALRINSPLFRLWYSSFSFHWIVVHLVIYLIFAIFILIHLTIARCQISCSVFLEIFASISLNIYQKYIFEALFQNKIALKYHNKGALRNEK